MSCSHFYYTEKEGTEGLLPPALQREVEISIFSAEDIILDPFIGNNFSTCCYRRSALQNISPATYDVVSYEWMINISVSQFGNTAVINQSMSVYRVSNSGSWSMLSEEEQLQGMIGILPEYDAILTHKYRLAFEKKGGMLKQQLQGLQQRKQTQYPAPENTSRLKDLLLGLFKRRVKH